MVSRLLEGVSGHLMEAQSDAKDGQLSYQTGGFSYTSRLGRVDTAVAQIQSDSQAAKVMSISSTNLVVVKLFSQASTVAGEEGQEIDDGTFIADDIHLSAYRL